MSKVRTTAYLMGLLDIEASPPVVVCVSLMSSNCPAVNLRKNRWVEVGCGYGRDFQEGIDHLAAQFKQRPDMGWMVPLVSDRDLEDLGLTR